MGWCSIRMAACATSSVISTPYNKRRMRFSLKRMQCRNPHETEPFDWTWGHVYDAEARAIVWSSDEV